MSNTMERDPTSQVIFALDQVDCDPRQTGQSQWESRCPAHNGSRRNLSILHGDDGRCLVHCHHEPSCSPESIVASLGLSIADLYPGREEGPGGSRPDDGKANCRAHQTPQLALSRIVKPFGAPSSHWSYAKPDGSEAFRVYRFDMTNSETGQPEKTYRPVHKTGDGWVLGDPPGLLPLYRLPELGDASTIYVCEGEKASDAIRDLGLVSTTSAHGAQSPHKTDWSPLAGKEIVILPDNDEAGEGYTRKVRDLLAKVDSPPTVRIVHLPTVWATSSPIPQGGDAADWVRDGVPDGWTPEDCCRKLEEVAADTPATYLVKGTRDSEAASEPLLPVGSTEDREELPIILPEWPAPVATDALHGLAGDIVRLIEPHTEADPVALLIQLLIGFGNIIGRSAHVVVGALKHYANEFAVLVGQTAAGRKGTSLAEALRFLAPCDPGWSASRVQGGLSSGEGLIYHVRDALTKREQIREKGKVIGTREIPDDPGEADKRLFVTETELGGTLKVMTRDGNTLSSLIRDAWDKGNLGTLVKNFPLRATGAHISIVGHITNAELRRFLSATDAVNGFANRFMWIAVHRTRMLPFGGNVPQADVDRLVARLKETADFGRSAFSLELSKKARDLWLVEYEKLAGARPGMLGSVTSRAEVHVLRLALIYAILDKSKLIKVVHLRAGLAVWDYALRSAAYIFGVRAGDRDADSILEALRASESGLSRDQIRNQVFTRNMPSHRIGEKLSLLASQGLAKGFTMRGPGPGRPTELWVACNPYATNAENTPGGSGENYGVNGVEASPDTDDDESSEDSGEENASAADESSPSGQAGDSSDQDEEMVDQAENVEYF
jgi:hypothetical protein